MSNCNHSHGDNVNGYWLCGKCYQKIPERPYFLYMEGTAGSGDTPRRQAVGMAQIRISNTGLSLRMFVQSMAGYIVNKAGWGRYAAMEYSVGLLKVWGVEFADSAYDWSEFGARELVKEDMEYWDDYGGNG